MSQLSSMLSLPPSSTRMKSIWTPAGLRAKVKARRFSLKVSSMIMIQSSSRQPSRLVIEQRTLEAWESKARKAT